MRRVVDAVDERDLLIVTLHGNVFAVHNQRTAESFEVAVRFADFVVVRQGSEFVL